MLNYTKRNLKNQKHLTIKIFFRSLIRWRGGLEEKDKLKRRIYITGILTLISAGYFLFGVPPTNFNLSMIYLVSLIGLLVLVLLVHITYLSCWKLKTQMHTTCLNQILILIIQKMKKKEY